MGLGPSPPNIDNSKNLKSLKDSLSRAVSCDREITENDVYLALKRFGSGKFTRHNGLPYVLYLRLLHIFVKILTVLFNNLFR